MFSRPGRELYARRRWANPVGVRPVGKALLRLLGEQAGTPRPGLTVSGTAELAGAEGQADTSISTKNELQTRTHARTHARTHTHTHTHTCIWSDQHISSFAQQYSSHKETICFSHNTLSQLWLKKKHSWVNKSSFDRNRPVCVHFMIFSKNSRVFIANLSHECNLKHSLASSTINATWEF